MTETYQPGDLVIYTAAPGACFHARVVGLVDGGIEILLGDDYLTWGKRVLDRELDPRVRENTLRAVQLARRAWPNEIGQARALRAAFVAGSEHVHEVWELQAGNASKDEISTVAKLEARRRYPGPE